jgi:hypothetical protein
MIVGTLIKWAVIGAVILAVIGIVVGLLYYYGYIGSSDEADDASTFKSGDGILESILPPVWRRRASGGPDIPVWT